MLRQNVSNLQNRTAPSFLGNLGLHFLLSLEVEGRQNPDSHVFPFRILEHLDVIEHMAPCIFAAAIGSPPNTLSLEQVEETFYDGVFVAVATPAH